jgi:ketosteroid isomerase-like protein
VDMSEQSLVDRLDRVESHLAIQQLAARYALAVDGRDLDTLVTLFVDDVHVGGRDGEVGRGALKEFFTTHVSGFYRSMHLISGHVIEFDDAEHAHGVVYCRAEHEDGDRWGIMVMNYKDTYERRDRQWFFTRRRLQPLYSCELLERPHGPNFNRGWGMEASSDGGDARLPEEHRTFAAYWEQFPTEHVERLTTTPVDRVVS